MKTISAGLREVADVETVREAVKLSGLEITELVSSASRGVQSAGERWAKEEDVPVCQFPVDRDDISHPDALIRIRDTVKRYDANASFRRNQQMADYAEALVAIWDGHNATVGDTIYRIKEKGLIKVFILGKSHPFMESAETDWRTVYWMRWRTRPSKELLENKQWVATRWHRTREIYFYRAAKNVLNALCACKDGPEFLREPTDRMRASCSKCKNSADIDALLKAKKDARNAYEEAKKNLEQAD
jgi:hypothetical protein